MSRALVPPCLLLLLLLAVARSADILAVFPHTGKSHFDVFQPLLLALAAGGHHVTVISFFPQLTPVANLTDITLRGVAPVFVNALKFEYLEGMNAITDFMAITGMGVDSCEPILTSRPVHELLRSSKDFDLLLVEIFNTDCFLGLVDHFEAPYIGLSSSSIFPDKYARLGSFDNPAFYPNLFLPLDARMQFPERLVNAATSAAMSLLRILHYSPRELRTVQTVFGRPVPLDRIALDVSLVFVNSHHSIQGALPLPPAYIEVGGLHIRPASPLPQEFEQYLNESERGVVVFSMGSVLQSSSFPIQKLQAIMEAFAELPVRVLMKWEEDTLPGKPDNVRLSKWLPQRDILAHHKVMVLMGHGGYLSTSEAVYCGVPMVLTPMFGDQPNNVAHLEALGAAVKLDFALINKHNVLHALRAVLYDSSYRRNVRVLSERFKDRPMSPLDTAVYWTEYVLRHRGAPHLRSPAVDMPWYQLWLLDVIGTVFIALTVLLLLVFWLAKRITLLISRAFCSDKSTKKTD